MTSIDAIWAANGPGPLRTPWGNADTATALGPLAVSVSTPSHGGVWVTNAGLARIPACWRETAYSPGPWFEEDCDWTIPYLWLGLGQHDGEFAANNERIARQIMRSQHPDCWEAFEVADALASEIRRAG